MLSGPRVQYPDGTTITPSPLDLSEVLRQLKQQNDIARSAFLCVFAHSLTVEIRALLLDPPSDADLQRVRRINEFLHQLTSCVNPRQRRSGTGDADLVRAIVETSLLYGLENAAGRALAAAAGNMQIKSDRSTVKNAAEAVCDAAAAAVHEFAAISGVSPREHLPEAFVFSFVFERLGGLFPMTLETSLRKVWRWHLDHLDVKWSRKKEDEEVSILTGKLGKPRVDLILYSGDPSDPSESRFLALVEFKLWTRSIVDREKILNILDHINTCPNGIICSVVDSSLEAEQAKQEGWYVAPVERLPHQVSGQYFAAVQHFTSRRYLDSDG
jgi:hypothetical protein